MYTFTPNTVISSDEIDSNFQELKDGTGIDAGAVTPDKRSGGFYIGSIPAATMASTGNKAITGVGFTPKLVQFTTADTNATNSSAIGVGAMTAAGQYVRALNATTAATARYTSTANCIAVIPASSSTPVQLASYVSLDSDGFTINVATALSQAVHFEAYG